MTASRAWVFLFTILFGAPVAANAAERTVTLAVANMFCATCPYTVRESLRRVPGVTGVEVSLTYRTAVVTYDDVTTNIHALTEATTNAGYPSRPAD